MPKRHHRNSAGVIESCFRSPFKRRKSASRARDRQLAAMPIDVQRDAQLSNLHQKGAVGFDAGKQLLASCDSTSKLILIACEPGLKHRRVVVEALASLDDLDALIEVRDGCDLSVEPKAVEKLGSQFSLFGIT